MVWEEHNGGLRLPSPEPFPGKTVLLARFMRCSQTLNLAARLDISRENFCGHDVI